MDIPELAVELLTHAQAHLVKMAPHVPRITTTSIVVVELAILVQLVKITTHVPTTHVLTKVLVKQPVQPSFVYALSFTQDNIANHTRMHVPTTHVLMVLHANPPLLDQHTHVAVDKDTLGLSVKYMIHVILIPA